MSQKIGRNAPCPCGSGRKFKHCCADKPSEPRDPASQSGPEWVPGSSAEPLELDEFEDFRRFAEETMHSINHAPLEDFAGLSPSQVHALNQKPFDTPVLLRLADPCPSPPHGQLIEMANWLLDAIGEAGVASTERGNLPRRVCRELLERAQAAAGPGDIEQHIRLNAETDFPRLHLVRVALELSGLLRKYRKRFVPTKRCLQRRAASGAQGIYPVLLRGYVTKFNWAWADGYSSSPMLQQTSWFVLWLLHRFGDSWRSSSFYEDAVLRAFPMLLEDFVGDRRLVWRTPEADFRAAVRLRVLERFAEAFGLIERRDSDRDQLVLNGPFELRRTKLFEQALLFPASAT